MKRRKSVKLIKCILDDISLGRRMALISTLKAKKTQPPLPHSKRRLDMDFNIGLGWKAFAKRRWKFLVFCLALAAFLEIFIFNLPFWESLSSSPAFEALSPSNTQGLVMDSKKDSGAAGRNAASSQVTIDLQSKSPIKFVRLTANPDLQASPGMQFRVASFLPGSSEPHPSNYWQLLNPSCPTSLYINTSGSYRRIQIQVRTDRGRPFIFYGAVINPRVPFDASPLRILFMILFIILAVFLGPSSPLYRLDLDLRSLFQTSLAILSTLLLMLFYLGIWYLFEARKIYVGDAGGAPYELYDLLAKSLLHGRTWLDVPVNPHLLALKNPYDPAERIKISGNPPVFWDCAFYHGKYYCYFGVIPALLLFVPFSLISGGRSLPTPAAVLLLVLLDILSLTLLVFKAAKSHLKECSPGGCLLIIWIFAIGCGLFFEVFQADTYAVPITCSLFFTFFGLWCWEMSKRGKNGKAHINSWWIFFGSLCMACNLGSRPQFEIASILVVAVFWKSVFKDRSLFSKSSILPSILLCLPYVIVFSLLLVYNHARFGSPFTFGNTYQLTVYDVEKEKWPKMGTLSVLYYYLFEPASLQAAFPFVFEPLPDLQVWQWEGPWIGGLFSALSPAFFLVFLIPWIYSKHRKSDTVSILKDGGYGTYSARRGLISFMGFTLFWILLVALADSYLAGLMQHYVCDFGTPLAILFAFSALSLLSLTASNPRYAQWGYLVRLLLFSALLYSILFHFFACFVNAGNGDIFNRIPRLYFHVKNWFLFLN